MASGADGVILTTNVDASDLGTTDLDVPVGLILGAVGGTPSGRWLTDEMLARYACTSSRYLPDFLTSS